METNATNSCCSVMFFFFVKKEKIEHAYVMKVAKDFVRGRGTLCIRGPCRQAELANGEGECVTPEYP